MDIAQSQVDSKLSKAVFRDRDRNGNGRPGSSPSSLLARLARLSNKKQKAAVREVGLLSVFDCGTDTSLSASRVLGLFVLRSVVVAAKPGLSAPLDEVAQLAGAP